MYQQGSHEFDHHVATLGPQSQAGYDERPGEHAWVLKIHPAG